MPTITDRVRRLLPSGLTGLAGLACAACCAIPLLLAAGVLSGAGWAAAGAWLPGIAVVLAALAGGAWWWAARRRHRGPLRRRCELRLLDRVTGMIAGGG